MPDDARTEPVPPLFPALTPYAQGWLAVGEGHEIRYEESGNPHGLPVLFLHGGPASGTSERQRRFFDPARYRICLFDQRGSGQSRPVGERQANTTAHLVADIERLREHLGIGQWLVFGGSWGSSLALAYAGAHRAVCLGLVLRGIFLTGRADMDWFFVQAGALAPDAWQRFAEHVGGTDFPSILSGYRQALEDAGSARARAACAQWVAWEAALSAPGRTPVLAAQSGTVTMATVLKYRLQAAYLERLCDLDESGVLAGARIAAGLPTAIIHGRLDLVCRPANAWQLAQAMPGSRLRLLANAGHDPWSTPMVEALITATQCFATDGDFRHWPGDGTQQ